MFCKALILIARKMLEEGGGFGAPPPLRNQVLGWLKKMQKVRNINAKMRGKNTFDLSRIECLSKKKLIVKNI